MQIRFTVEGKLVTVRLFYNAYSIDTVRSKCFSDWKHCLAEVGDWLPFTSCEIVIHGED